MQSQTVITGVIFLMHCYSSYTHCCVDRDLRTVSVIDGASNTLIENIVVGTELVALLFNPYDNNTYAADNFLILILNNIEHQAPSEFRLAIVTL